MDYKLNLHFHIVAGQQEFQDLLNSTDVKAMYQKCVELSESTPLDTEGKLRGYCVVCEKVVEFSYGWLYSHMEKINFREHLLCPGCNLNNRQRGIANVVFKLLV